MNNLLSKGVINADGTPGANYARVTHFQSDITGSPTYQLSPTKGKTAYLTLPAPLPRQARKRSSTNDEARNLIEMHEHADDFKEE